MYKKLAIDPLSVICDWKFDEVSGDIVYDSSGNGNDGLMIDVTRVIDNDKPALYFNGISSYIEVLKSPSLDSITNEITIVATIKTPPLGSPRATLAEKWFYDPTPQRSYVITYETDGSIWFGLSSNGVFPPTGYGSLKTLLKLQPDTIYNTAFTSDGVTMKIYINGVQDINTALSPIGGIYVSTENLHIGMWKWSETQPSTVNYTNLMYNIKLLNVALTQEEIQNEICPSLSCILEVT